MMEIKWVELAWTKGMGTPLDNSPTMLKVFFISKDTQEAKHKVLKDYLKNEGWETKATVSHLGNCISRRKDGTTQFIIAVSGDSLQERMAIAAHEAYHLTEDFWAGRQIPRKSDVNREEHKARLLEVVVREYYRLCEAEGIPARTLS
jgi:hypothetical protein